MRKRGEQIWAPVEFLKVLNNIKINEGLKSRAEAMRKCADYAECGMTAKELAEIKKLRELL